MLSNRLIHIGVGCLVLVFVGRGLSYRTLWTDEVETAERARTILESGLPRTIDRNGDPSVNIGGMEIEDGTIHRYTPWIQFYVAAAGLATSKMLGLSPDFGVRIPFVLAHAFTSGLISFGLVQACGVPLPIAAVTAVAFGFQTIRVLHDRTSRYHALLDLMTVIGMLALGCLPLTGNLFRWSFAFTIALLPQIHYLGGGVIAFALTTLFFSRLTEAAPNHRDKLRQAAFLVLPWTLTILATVVQVRPFTSRTEIMRLVPLHSIFGVVSDFRAISYPLVFIVSSAVALWIYRKKQTVYALVLLLAALGISLYISSICHFFQVRYFFSVAILMLFWPVALSYRPTTKGLRLCLGFSILMFTLIPEAPIGNVTWLRKFDKWPMPTPFHGVRVAYDDSRKSGNVAQPMREVVEYIQANSDPTDPVLFDYVPQFTNWYLPGHPVSLMPDAKQITPRNKNNAIWSSPIKMPKWHIWYPTLGSGAWFCFDHCDYVTSNVDFSKRTYTLHSNRSRKSLAMCIVKEWRTSPWNNSPLETFRAEAFVPTGISDQRLILAKACETP